MPTTPTRGNTSYTASASGTATLTANYPTGGSSGDLLFMLVVCSRSTTTTFALNTPSGGGTWNLLRTEDQHSSGYLMAWYYCIRGSETSVTITPTVTTSWYYTIAEIVSYQANTFDPIMPIYTASQTDSFSNTAGTTPLSTFAVYPEVANAEILLMSAMYAGTNTPTMNTIWSGVDAEIMDNCTADATNVLTWNLSAAYADRATTGVSPTYSAAPSVSAVSKVVSGFIVNPVNDFPVPIANTTGFTDSAVTSTSVTLPSSITGDLLLVEFVANGNVTISTSSSNWTKIGQYGNSSGDAIALFAGISGTASSTLSVSQSSSGHNAYIARCIRRWSGTISDIGVASATGSSTNMDPPSLTPAQGTQDYFWIVTGVGVAGTTWPTADPGVDYYGLTQVRCNSSSTSTHVGFADDWIWFTASTINPNPFTSTTCAWGTLTISIPPSVAKPVSESGTVSDSARISTSGTETAALSDSAAISATTYATESLSITETAVVMVLAADSAGLTEALTLGIAAADAASGTDTVPQIKLSAADTISAADNPQLQNIYAVLDALSASDLAQLVLGTTDSISATDSATAIIGSNKTASDAMSMLDSAQIASLVTASDSISWSETAQIVILGADSVTTSDMGTFTYEQWFTVSEAIAAAETANIGARVSESMSVSESAVIASLASVSDTMTISETARVLIYASDTMAEFDSASLRANGVLQGSRVFRVPAEDRTYRVPAESRTFTVPEEDRTYTVPAEKRVFVVPKENRTYGPRAE